MSQKYADGFHTLVYRYGGRRWIIGGWWEEWTCRGCGIRFYLKGKRVQDVAKMTARLQNEHSNFMSWTAVFTQLAELKVACRAVGVKMKADLTQSIYSDSSNIAKRQREQYKDDRQRG